MIEALFKGTNVKTLIRRDSAPLLVYMLLKSAASGTRLPTFDWDRYITSPRHSFLICEMGIIATISK